MAVFLKYTVKVAGVLNVYVSVLIAELVPAVFFTKTLSVVVLVMAILLVPTAEGDAMVGVVPSRV